MSASEDAAAYAAFAAFQGEVKAPAKNKMATVPGRDGKAGYKYAYADIADVLAAALPTLSKHGLALSQSLSVENGTLVLRTRLVHKEGGVIDGGFMFCGAAGVAMQQIGGNLTYARRYAACTVLGIAAEEDTDGPPPGYSEPPRRAAPPPPPRRPQDQYRAPPPPPVEDGPVLTDEQAADEAAFLVELEDQSDVGGISAVWARWKPRFADTMSTDLQKLMHAHVARAADRLPR